MVISLLYVWLHDLPISAVIDSEEEISALADPTAGTSNPTPMVEETLLVIDSCRCWEYSLVSVCVLDVLKPYVSVRVCVPTMVPNDLHSPAMLVTGQALHSSRLSKLIVPEGQLVQVFAERLRRLSPLHALQEFKSLGEADHEPVGQAHSREYLYVLYTSSAS